MKETDIQKACLQYLTERGIFCWRQNQGVIPTGRGGFRKFNGIKGQSDIIGVLNDGRFFACEVKMPKKKPSPEQYAFLDAVNARGGIGVVVTSVDELKEELSHFV